MYDVMADYSTNKYIAKYKNLNSMAQNIRQLPPPPRKDYRMHVLHELIPSCKLYQIIIIFLKFTDRLSVESSTSPTSPRFIEVIKLTHSVLIASLSKLVAFASV